MQKNYPKESQIFFNEILNLNTTHYFKFDKCINSWNLIFLECTKCNCVIQLNYKIKETMFSMNDNEPPILFDEYLTCNEVLIKKLLE